MAFDLPHNTTSFLNNTHASIQCLDGWGDLGFHMPLYTVRQSQRRSKPTVTSNPIHNHHTSHTTSSPQCRTAASPTSRRYHTDSQLFFTRCGSPAPHASTPPQAVTHHFCITHRRVAAASYLHNCLTRRNDIPFLSITLRHNVARRIYQYSKH